MYDVFLCADEPSLVVSKRDSFGADGCAGTDTLGTYAISDTALGYGAGWGATIVHFGVNSYGNVGRGGVGAIGFSMACGPGKARLRSVAIFLI